MRAMLHGILPALGIALLVGTFLFESQLAQHYSHVVFQRMQTEEGYYPGYEGWESWATGIQIVFSLLLFVPVPALVLTLVVAQRRKRRQKPTRWFTTLGISLGVLTIVVMVLLHCSFSYW